MLVTSGGPPASLRDRGKCRHRPQGKRNQSVNIEVAQLRWVLIDSGDVIVQRIQTRSARILQYGKIVDDRARPGGKGD